MNLTVTARLAACVAILLLFTLPAVSFAEDHPGWAEATSGNGDYGYLRKWFFEDGCPGKGFTACKDFKAALTIGDKFPTPLVTDALVFGGDNLSSKSCIPAWGCATMIPSLELIGMRGSPDDKALLDGFFANAELWESNHARTRRAVLVRILGWYGDKTFAPVIKSMVEFEPGLEFSNVALASAAALFEQWGDNSLIETCQATFDPSIDSPAIQDARSACAHYLLKFGDKTVAGKLKRAKPGSDAYTAVLLGGMGDSSNKAEWQTTVKDFAGSPDRTERAAALAALALLGDAKAEKEYLALLTGKNPDAAFEHAQILSILQGTPLAKKAAAAVKKVVGKLDAKDKIGRTRAMMVAFLLRSGDASVLPDAVALFASDDTDVRGQLAGALAGTLRGGPFVGPSNGIYGGAPVAGLGKVLDEAWGNESDLSVKTSIAQAWVMLRSVGGN
jgi:hypothetical protein